MEAQVPGEKRDAIEGSAGVTEPGELPPGRGYSANPGVRKAIQTGRSPSASGSSSNATASGRLRCVRAHNYWSCRQPSGRRSGRSIA